MYHCGLLPILGLLLHIAHAHNWLYITKISIFYAIPIFLKFPVVNPQNICPEANFSFLLLFCISNRQWPL